MQTKSGGKDLGESGNGGTTPEQNTKVKDSIEEITAFRHPGK